MKNYIVMASDGFVASVVARFNSREDAENYTELRNRQSDGDFVFEAFEE